MSAGCQRSCQCNLLAEPFIKGTDFQAQASVPPFTETKVTFGVGTNPVGADVIFLPEKPGSHLPECMRGFPISRGTFSLSGPPSSTSCSMVARECAFRCAGQVSVSCLYVPAHVKRLHGRKTQVWIRTWCTWRMHFRLGSGERNRIVLLAGVDDFRTSHS